MNLNKVFLLGNAASDPEVRMTASGTAVANFRLATNRVFKDKNGQKQEQAEFHNVVFWGRQAEIVRDYVQKGKLLFIEGRLQTRSWQDQNGQKHWRTEIICENFQLGPRGNASQGTSYQPKPAKQSKQDSGEEEIPVIEEDSPISFDDEESKEVDPKDIPF